MLRDPLDFLNPCVIERTQHRIVRHVHCVLRQLLRPQFQRLVDLRVTVDEHVLPCVPATVNIVRCGYRFDQPFRLALCFRVKPVERYEVRLRQHVVYPCLRDSLVGHLLSLLPVYPAQVQSEDIRIMGDLQVLFLGFPRRLAVRFLYRADDAQFVKVRKLQLAERFQVLSVHHPDSVVARLVNVIGHARHRLNPIPLSLRALLAQAMES